MNDFAQALGLPIAAAPEPPKPTPEEIGEARRSQAIGIAVSLVTGGRLEAWEAFDYAAGILQFVRDGTPFRFSRTDDEWGAIKPKDRGVKKQ